MRVCVHAHAYVCVSVCICMYKYMRVWVSVCMLLCVRMHVLGEGVVSDLLVAMKAKWIPLKSPWHLSQS